MVIVVEGKNDYNKIKSIFPDAEVLITNGSAVSSEFLVMLKKLSAVEQIVLCLDPDGPGEKIRNEITKVVPNTCHVFAKKSLAISKNHRKVGIEHMDNDDIKDLFTNLKFNRLGSDVTYQDLLDLGLSGSPLSKAKRELLGESLGIGVCNTKQLLKRINMFGINLKEIKDFYDCR